MDQKIVRKRLSNGLEIAVEEMPQLGSVSLGMWFLNGSRHESEHQSGLSHFIEHLLFKGSRNHTCEEIARKIDHLGGNVDAFTSREKTSYVAKVMDSQFEEALSLLSEIVFNPAFDSGDLAMERDVVVEEIRMVHDTPDDLVHEVFTKSLYGDHPLGQSILGTEESVRAFDHDLVHSFYVDHYRPDRVLITVAGNVDSTDAITLCESLFGGMNPNGNGLKTIPPQYRGEIDLLERDTLEQVQLLMGVQTFEVTSEHRHALEILNTYLGGSMSSRLFQSIRERLGLAYSIHSFTHGFTDTGYLAVYGATSPDRIEMMVDQIRAELESTARGEFTKEDVDRVKAMIKTDFMLGLESSSSRMGMLAKQILYFGEIKPLDQLIAEFDAVTYTDVVELAQTILKGSSLTASVIGNIGAKNLNFDDLGG